MAGYDPYDYEGYPIFERVKTSINTYSLQPHELKSLEEVQEAIESNKIDSKQAKTYIEYLDNLETKISTIIVTEEKEGISNFPLKSDLMLIRRLKEQLKARAEKTIRIRN